MSVAASLEPSTIRVDPGATGSVVVRLRNTGSIVDRYDLSVVGPSTGWAAIEPPSLSLFPGQAGEVRVSFRPARGPMPRAGTFPFGIRIAPAANPGATTVEEGRVTVTPFAELAAELVPQTSRGSRAGSHQVVLANRGNAPVAALVAASDPDRLLTLDVQPPRVVVGPGEQGSATIRATAGETFLRGSPRTIPFGVTVEVAEQPPIALRGGFAQRGVLPGWAMPAIGLAGLAVVALVVLPLLTGRTPPNSAVRTDGPSTPSPSATAASEPPTASPTLEPSPSVVASVGPSVTPEPGPFEVALANDAVVLGGALELKCPPEPADASCRQTALDTLRVLATSLEGPYGGTGLVSTASTSLPNTLPIALERDVPFPWLAQGGAVTDHTPRLVVDLAPLLASPPGFAYAIVDSAAGPRRFVVPDPLARQLLDTLYQPATWVPVEPLPQRTIPPYITEWDPGILVYVFATPAP